VDAEEIALQESLFVESEHAALDGYSSEGRLERAEDAREELRRLFRDDARDRDQPLVPAELPCEANTEINKLFSWYEGDITTLEVDAIVCPVPERASVTTALGQHIHAAAGGRLRQELETVGKKWRVGEARITLGYDLPARYVIHVKVPETHRPELMAQCVNAALDLAKKLKMHTVAMPPLACAAPQYPRFNGVHVAALTARRWLDVISNRRTIDKVIFVSDTPAPAPALALGAESGTGVETAVLAGGLGAESDASDSAAFKRILPLYFPGPNLNTDTLRLRYLSYRESYAPTLEDPEFKKMLAKMTYDECRLDEDDGAPGGGHTSIWRNGVRTDVGK
jgi:O-acetyl-ADP-ribose deacetylase (regulator of RNase III)